MVYQKSVKTTKVLYHEQLNFVDYSSYVEPYTFINSSRRSSTTVASVSNITTSWCGIVCIYK